MLYSSLWCVLLRAWCYLEFSRLLLRPLWASWKYGSVLFAIYVWRMRKWLRVWSSVQVFMFIQSWSECRSNLSLGRRKSCRPSAACFTVSQRAKEDHCGRTEHFFIFLGNSVFDGIALVLLLLDIQLIRDLLQIVKTKEFFIFSPAVSWTGWYCVFGQRDRHPSWICSWFCHG